MKFPIGAFGRTTFRGFMAVSFKEWCYEFINHPSVIGKMVGRAPWVGTRTLNNQPHIHLTICGYLLDPKPLLKGSGHRGFSL